MDLIFSWDLLNGQKVPKSDFQSRFSMDHMDGSKPGKGLGRYFIKISVIGKCFFLLEVHSLLLTFPTLFLLECCQPD